jgi:hypothetical protein
METPGARPPLLELDAALRQVAPVRRHLTPRAFLKTTKHGEWECRGISVTALILIIQ